MKVLDWSLAQEIKVPHKATVSQMGTNELAIKRPYHEPWYLYNFYCKKGQHLVDKRTVQYSKGNNRPLCPIHRQFVRFHSLRKKGQVDNRKRVDC